jgi:hypothetical protein
MTSVFVNIYPPELGLIQKFKKRFAMRDDRLEVNQRFPAITERKEK